MKVRDYKMNLNVFRAYDIRGVYPTDINEEFAYRMGQAYGSYLQEKLNQTSCVVSHDNRLSSESLSDNLIRGLLATGLNVYDYGLTTTPMHYYARYIEHLFGVMITASHNPKDENGFKFSLDYIANARGEMIENFKNYFVNGKFLVGQGVLFHNSIEDKYVKYMVDNIHLGNRKPKIVLDLGNGTTAVIASKIFTALNMTPIYINETSDGNFPNHHPDPSEPENMKQLIQAVKKNKADCGFAFDGDGDRVGMVDDKGEIVSTEEFMIFIIRELVNKSFSNTYLYDVKCSKALEYEIIKAGGTPLEYRTGASYTEAKTKEENLAFGGEYSGHLFFRDRDACIGSGIYAALRMIELLSKDKTKVVSKMKKTIKQYFNTPEIRYHVDDDKKFGLIEKIKEYAHQHHYYTNEIDGVKIIFTNGWALIRASNTGPNITLRYEAETKQDLEKLKNNIDNLIKTFSK